MPPHVTASLHRCAQLSPDSLATVDVPSGRTKTYSQLHQRVGQLAGALQQTCELSSNARVAVLMLNSDRYFESFYAVPWAGGIVLPVNIRLAAPEMVEVFTDAAIEILLVDEAFADMLPQIRPHVPSLKCVVYAGDGSVPSDCLGYEDLLKTTDPAPDQLAGGSDTFGLFYTGGTTGKPKGVELTHSNVVFNALGHVAMLQYDGTSRYLHSAPMFHLADGASTFGITLAGGTHVFIRKFAPGDMLSAIAKHKVTKAMMVPVMIQMMLGADKVGEFDCSSLGVILYGAAPMPQSLLKPAMLQFPNAKFIQGYGMTETSPAVTMLTAEHHIEGNPRMGSVGVAVPWVEVKVVDESDIEVARGNVGEIVTRGPHVMKGYWGKPELTAQTLKGGWMHTGDAGRMDKDGFVFIVDRIKDMIITGGENVYSAEVEAAVMSYPGVGMVAVIGTPDDMYGQIVTAIVAPQNPKAALDTAAMVEHCRSKIAGFKCPRRVIVLPEGLPVSGAGKILKADLRKTYAKVSSNL